MLNPHCLLCLVLLMEFIKKTIFLRSGLPPSPLTVSLTIFMTSLTQLSIVKCFFYIIFILFSHWTGSVCLPGVRLPCRASLRRRRRVHPGILRILRQPHLQVDRLIGRSIADFIFSEKFYDVQKIHPSPPFQAIWLWSVGCGIKRVWLQHHGLQS